METRSDVWCTNCSRNFVATLDLALNGNHEITCPLCQHIHYRVVRDGQVTEDRYRSSAGPTFIATSFTTTASSNYVSTSFYTGLNTSSTTFIGNSWLNRSDITV